MFLGAALRGSGVALPLAGRACCALCTCGGELRWCDAEGACTGGEDEGDEADCCCCGADPSFLSYDGSTPGGADGSEDGVVPADLGRDGSPGDEEEWF